MLLAWIAPDSIGCAKMRSVLISDKGNRPRTILAELKLTRRSMFSAARVNAAEEVVLRKKLWRKEIVMFFEKLAPAIIAIEVCGVSHHRARWLQSFGHTGKLIPPQLVKPTSQATGTMRPTPRRCLRR